MKSKNHLTSHDIAEIQRALGGGASIENLVAQTRGAYGVVVKTITPSESGLFWLSRRVCDEDFEANFPRVMRSFSKLTLSPKSKAFGLTDQRRPYVMQNILPQSSLEDLNSKSQGQSFELVKEILRSVGQIHYFKYPLGDLCPSSFLFDEQGHLWLCATLGLTGANDIVEPDEDCRYAAPEVLDGNKPTLRSDVYSLGVIAYWLATKTWPFGESFFREALGQPLSSSIAPSSICAGAPPWLDDLVGRALEGDPAKRFSDAVAMFSFIEKYDSQNPTNYWNSHSLVESQDAAYSEEGPQTKAKKVRSKDSQAFSGKEEVFAGDSSSARPARFSLGMTTSVLFALIVGVSLYISFRVVSYLESQDEQPATVDVTKVPGLSLETKAYLQELIASSTGSARAREVLKKVSLMEEPGVNQVMSIISEGALGEELASEAVALSIARIANQGLVQSSKLMESWVTKVNESGRKPGKEKTYAELLLAANPQEEIEKRKSSLYDIYTREKEFGIQFACALAIDQESSGLFLTPLKELLSLHYPQVRIPQVNLPVLILGFREPSMMFGGLMLPRLSSLGDEDLMWLIKRDTLREFKLFFQMSREIVKRKLLKPEREFFFNVLDEKWPSVSPEVLDALVSAATSSTTSKDLKVISEWYSPRLEELLFRFLTLDEDESVMLSAFDKVANRGLGKEPVKGLLKWVQANDWNNRKGYIRPIGVIVFAEEFGVERVAAAFDTLAELMDKKTLFEMFVKSERPMLMVVALDRFGGKARPDLIMGYLKHADPQVRIAAVKSLQGVNLTDSRRILLKRFSEEKDPLVLQAYKEFHSYISTEGSD